MKRLKERGSKDRKIEGRSKDPKGFETQVRQIPKHI